jgi:hypothetical protein
MNDEIEILRDISSRFGSAGIAFMLTGSMAMNYYSQPRMTRDIDLVVELVPEDIDRVVGLLTPEYYISREALAGAISAHSIFNIVHQDTVIKVDCIIRKPSEFRRLEFSRRQRIEISGFETWIVSREDLIISKLEWAKDSHSEFQLRDVRNLLAGECDRAYVEYWTRDLGLTKLLEECRHE